MPSPPSLSVVAAATSCEQPSTLFHRNLLAAATSCEQPSTLFHRNLLPPPAFSFPHCNTLSHRWLPSLLLMLILPVLIPQKKKKKNGVEEALFGTGLPNKIKLFSI
ncbi:hypothetical protein CsSME_00010948 [Camellia sinensis var. sinensis]